MNLPPFLNYKLLRRRICVFTLPTPQYQAQGQVHCVCSVGVSWIYGCCYCFPVMFVSDTKKQFFNNWILVASQKIHRTALLFLPFSSAFLPPFFFLSLSPTFPPSLSLFLSFFIFPFIQNHWIKVICFLSHALILSDCIFNPKTQLGLHH